MANVGPPSGSIFDTIGATEKCTAAREQSHGVQHELDFHHLRAGICLVVCKNGCSGRAIIREFSAKE